MARRLEVTCFGGLHPPLSGLSVVLLSTFAVGIHQRNRVLRRNVSLFGSLQRLLKGECRIAANSCSGRKILTGQVSSSGAEEIDRLLAASVRRNRGTCLVILAIPGCFSGNVIQPRLPPAFRSLAFRPAEIPAEIFCPRIGASVFAAMVRGSSSLSSSRATNALNNAGS